MSTSEPRSPDSPCPACGYLTADGPCARCGGRVPAALAGAWRGGLVEGALALPRGLFLLLGTPRTKRLLVPPVLLTLALFGLVFRWLFLALGRLAERARPEAGADTGAVERWLAASGAGELALEAGQWLLFLLAALLALWLTFSVVYELIAGPFLDAVHGRIEQRWYGPEREPARGGPAAAHWVRRGLLELRTLWVSLRAALLVLVVLASTFWLQFVPVVGFPLFLAIAGFTTAISLLDIPVSRRRWSLGLELALARRHALALATFGALSSLLFLVPVLGPILMVPVASVGGLWLFCRIDKGRPSHRRSP